MPICFQEFRESAPDAHGNIIGQLPSERPVSLLHAVIMPTVFCLHDIVFLKDSFLKSTMRNSFLLFPIPFLLPSPLIHLCSLPFFSSLSSICIFCVLGPCISYWVFFHSLIQQRFFTVICHWQHKWLLHSLLNSIQTSFRLAHQICPSHSEGRRCIVSSWAVRAYHGRCKERLWPCASGPAQCLKHSLDEAKDRHWHWHTSFFS